jgi:AcrR family transcriptional regulator
MTLTAKGQATRQRIIEGAATHLRSQDPGSMTLDDVREITRTSKGQLFHYFPGGKEELLLEVARLEANRVLDDQQPHLGALDSWVAWERWRKAVVARYRAQGALCPLGSLMDQVRTVPGAAEVSTTLLRQWEEHVRRGIAGMQACGKIRASVDAKRTAAAFIAGIQGGVSVLRTTGSVDHLESILDLLISYLRDALPEPAEQAEHLRPAASLGGDVTRGGAAEGGQRLARGGLIGLGAHPVPRVGVDESLVRVADAVHAELGGDLVRRLGGVPEVVIAAGDGQHGTADVIHRDGAGSTGRPPSVHAGCVVSFCAGLTSALGE